MLNRRTIPAGLISLLLLLAASAYGQTMVVRGTLVDSATKSPISFATVAITKPDNKALQTGFTDDSGHFSLKAPLAAELLLHISYVGYHTYSAKVHPVAGVADVGIIRLSARTGVLTEIVVSGRKPLIQSSGDKLVYNAAADIGNRSGSASDVLRKAPMITVGADGEVRLKGDANIKVLLNGLPSGMMAKNLKEALKAIPASMIESIEIITSPSAKYEAEGAAGVINIVTKKKLKGAGGSIDLSAGNLEQSINGNLNATQGKFSLNLNVEGSMEKSRTVSATNRTSSNEGHLFQRNDETQRFKGVFSELALEYRPDSSQKIGANVSYWTAKWPSAAEIYSRYQDKQNINEYNQSSDQGGKANFVEFSLNYQKKFKRPEQELQLISQYNTGNDRAQYLTNQSDMNGKSYFRERSPNTSNSREFSFQADYTQPLDRKGKQLLEIGGRYSQNNSGSDYTVFNNRLTPGSDQLTEDTSRANRMTYHQRIAAGYINFRFKLPKGWGARLGTRFEHTSLGADFKSTQPSFNTQFSNLVTSALLSKKINDIHELKLSYAERIRRPMIWDLNPYVNASDPRNLTSGNPGLRPEINRMLELAHAYVAPSGFNLNSSLFYHANSNAIEPLRTVDSSGVSRTSSQNIGASRSFGGNAYSMLQFSNEWTMILGAELYRVWYRSKALDARNAATIYELSLNSSYELPKDIILQFSGDFSNAYVTLQGKTSANYNYRFSARKEFWNKQAGITLSVNNPFQQRLMQRNTAWGPSFSSNTTSWYYNQSFSIAFNWKFGKVKAATEEEQPQSGNDKHMRQPQNKVAPGH
ncbi:outer membrane beta-barrel protein [Chitinophaga vietnamensis]|uniref:outer membrane beta-barrel protein n=1 Tax=Chitinophaga vietnamensis TaxID=2593957 RepID=UPI0011781C1E|nr:outer membrane beta-barrel protein [Chitinophaga vietnamensis]